MSRTKNARHGRRRLPAVTRKQLRARARDLQDALRQANHQLAGAEHLIDGQQLRIAELEAQVEQRAADSVDVSVLRKQLAAAEEANRALTADNTALKAERENATAIDVPPMHRDTSDPDDQHTEPIYVRAWREHMERVEVTAEMPTVKPLADALGGAR